MQVMGARQVAYGDPSQAVRLVDFAVGPLEPDELLVQVEAVPLHIADLKFIRGDDGFRWFPVPRWIGGEGVGRVVAAGGDCDTPKIGDRVFLPVLSGTLREHMTVRRDAVTPCPEGDAAQLCLVPINALTAATLLTEYAAVSPGDWIIQSGANSSCGRYLIRLAADMGVKTVNIVRRQGLEAELRELGADLVVSDASEPDQMAQRIFEATGGAPIRVGIDCIGGSHTLAIARSLSSGGVVVSYGFASGDPCKIAFQDLAVRGISLKGMMLFDHRQPMPQSPLLAKVADYVSRGHLKAKIAAEYPLSEIHAALSHQMRDGLARDGKIIVRPMSA